VLINKHTNSKTYSGQNVMALDSQLDGCKFNFWPPQYFTKPPRPTQPPTSAGWEMSTSQSVVMLCSWE